MEAQCRAAARFLVTAFSGDILPMLASDSAPRRLTSGELDTIVEALAQADTEGIVLSHIHDLSAAISSSSTPAAKAANAARNREGAAVGLSSAPPAPATAAAPDPPAPGVPAPAPPPCTPSKPDAPLLASVRGVVVSTKATDDAPETNETLMKVTASAGAAGPPVSLSGGGAPQVSAASPLSELPAPKADMVLGGRTSPAAALLGGKPALPEISSIVCARKTSLALGTNSRALSVKRAGYSIADLTNMLRGAIGKDLESASTLFLEVLISSSHHHSGMDRRRSKAAFVRDCATDVSL